LTTGPDGVAVVISERRQLPAGQGFFHAGEVFEPRDRPNAYRYVYDCGTSGITQPNDFELAASVEQLGKLWHDSPGFDTLFISHLHRDHVSGLPLLLGRFRPQVIVLPYTDVSERLIAAGQSMWNSEAEVLPGDASELDFYHRLIADPGGFLSEFAESGVVFVRHNAIVESGAPGEPNRPSWDVGSIFSAGPIAEVSDQQDIATKSTGRVNWILRPYVDEASFRQRVQFHQILSTLVDVPVPEMEEWLSHTENVLLVLVDHMKELGNLLRTDAHDFNVTSMSLYSGPALSFVSHHFAWSSNGRHETSCSSRAPGWIGAGDSKLRNKARRESFLAHFAEVSDRVTTFALPHHGSKNNHHVSLLSTFRPRICVVGSGYLYGAAHPHPTVRADLNTRNIELVVIDDSDSWLLEKTVSSTSVAGCFHDLFPDFDPPYWWY
jgi:hypothetical protein